MKRPILLRAAWTLAALLALVVLFKTFVGSVYHVDTGSMEPTIWGEDGGEWVFVRYDRSAPARQELVVIQRAGESAPIVKRVVGLPGENVQISRGDLLIDRQRLRPSERRPPLVPVFDSTWHKVEERFQLRDVEARRWTRKGATWELDARDVPSGSKDGLLLLHDTLNDDYLGPRHELVRGESQANDASIACETRLDDVRACARLGLSEQGDVFEARIELVSSDAADVTLTRTASRGEGEPGAVETLAQQRITLSVGTWTSFALENVDNVLRVRFEGPGAPIVVTYRENTPHPADGLGEGKSFGARAWFGGEAGRLAFRSIEVARDLVYTDRGRIGVQSEVQLGPGEYFVLGDNSTTSRDSREWGPVRAEEIVGRPTRVVWPPARWRGLESLAGPPRGTGPAPAR